MTLWSQSGGFIPPLEKGRQGGPMELGRPSEGGKRDCSPSEGVDGENQRADDPPTLTPITEMERIPQGNIYLPY